MVKSAANEVNGSWLSHQAAEALRHLRREFDMNRDPMVAAQLQDMDKTEAQRRRALDTSHSQSQQSQSEQGEGEQTGGGQSVKPTQNGLAAQRDAAFKSHAQFKQSKPANEQNNAPHHKPRNAPRYSGPSM